MAYAAKIIAQGGSPSRAFDNCFENYDGDEVSVAIVRRARRNPKIAANLSRYLNAELAEECARRMETIPTRKLADAARVTRQRRQAAWDAELEAMKARADPD